MNDHTPGQDAPPQQDTQLNYGQNNAQVQAQAGSSSQVPTDDIPESAEHQQQQRSGAGLSRTIRSSSRAMRSILRKGPSPMMRRELALFEDHERQSERAQVSRSMSEASPRPDFQVVRRPRSLMPHGFRPPRAPRSTNQSRSGPSFLTPNGVYYDKSRDPRLRRERDPVDELIARFSGSGIGTATAGASSSRTQIPEASGSGRGRGGRDWRARADTNARPPEREPADAWKPTNTYVNPEAQAAPRSTSGVDALPSLLFDPSLPGPGAWPDPNVDALAAAAGVPLPDVPLPDIPHFDTFPDPAPQPRIDKGKGRAVEEAPPEPLISVPLPVVADSAIPAAQAENAALDPGPVPSSSAPAVPARIPTPPTPALSYTPLPTIEVQPPVTQPSISIPLPSIPKLPEPQPPTQEPVASQPLVFPTPIASPPAPQPLNTQPQAPPPPVAQVSVPQPQLFAYPPIPTPNTSFVGPIRSTKVIRLLHTASPYARHHPDYRPAAMSLNSKTPWNAFLQSLDSRDPIHIDAYACQNSANPEENAMALSHLDRAVERHYWTQRWLRSCQMDVDWMDLDGSGVDDFVENGNLPPLTMIIPEEIKPVIYQRLRDLDDALTPLDHLTARLDSSSDSRPVVARASAMNDESRDRYRYIYKGYRLLAAQLVGRRKMEEWFPTSLDWDADIII